MSTNITTEQAEQAAEADLADSTATTPPVVYTMTIRSRGQFPIPQPPVRVVEVTEAPMTTVEAKRRSREEFRARRKAYMKEYHKHYVRPADRAKKGMRK